MSWRPFIRRGYPESYTDPDPDAPVTRGELDNLERRIEAFSDARTSVFLSGRMIKDVGLRAVQSANLGQLENLGRTTWEVSNNASIDGTTITVTTSGGSLPAKVGSGGDIAKGGAAADTAANIISFFNGKAGVQAVSGGAALVQFQCLPNHAPVAGSIVYASDLTGGGFTPDFALVNPTTGPLWVSALCQYTSIPSFRIGDYVRVRQATSLSTPSASDRPILLPGRMKILAVSGDTVYFDQIIPGVVGGNLLYPENDNIITPGFSPTDGRYRWMVARQSQPGSIWEESSLGPNTTGVGKRSLALRTERDMTADIWVW
jgi:hypothetical protein